MKRIFRDHGLSLVLAGLFLLFWAGQAFTGFSVHQSETLREGGTPGSFAAYLTGGHFWSATAENWESEFLQMGAYVVLTVYLFQRGSAESHDPDQAEELREKRRSCRATWLYRNSLSLVLMALFAGAFVMHACSSRQEFNDQRALRGEAPAAYAEYLSSPEFWFESFQNWQSEFLAVLTIVVLSIFLRQNGSPESKPVGAPNAATGD